jgi:hypothetical protein
MSVGGICYLTKAWVRRMVLRKRGKDERGILKCLLFIFLLSAFFIQKKKKFFLIFEFFIELKRYSKVQTLPNICFILYYLRFYFGLFFIEPNGNV